MYCPQCGTQIDDSAVFCGNCGTRLSDSSPQNAPAPEPVSTPAPTPAFTPAPAAPAPAVQGITVHPVISAIKKLATSPLCLIAAVAFTLMIIISISDAGIIGDGFVDMISRQIMLMFVSKIITVFCVA